jgi:hypothetical protein
MSEKHSIVETTIVFLAFYIALDFIRNPLYDFVHIQIGLNDFFILIIGLLLMVVCGYWSGKLDQ